MNKIKLTEIKINEDRLRKDKGNLADLKESITAHGVFTPIVLDRNNVLIAGERRLTACRELNLTEIPYVYLEDLDELTRTEIEFEENICRKDFSDEEKVSAVARLHVLKQKKFGTLPQGGKGTGWSAGDTAEAIGMNAGTVSICLQVNGALKNDAVKTALKSGGLQAAYKVVQEEKIKAVTKLLSAKAVTTAAEKQLRMPTDYYLRGDCTELIKSIPDNTIDLVFGDPPFGINVNEMNYFSSTGGSATKDNIQYDDSPVAVSNMWMKLVPELWRVMKPDSFFFFWCSLSNKEAEILMKNAGFKLGPNYFMWCKDEESSYSPVPDRGFASAVEFAFYGWKGTPTLVKRGKLNYSLARLVRDKVHPHEKPVEMQQELIERFCITGSRILDPWAGSTSVIRAALNAQMTPIGFESNENHYSNGLLALNKYLNGF